MDKTTYLLQSMRHCVKACLPLLFIFAYHLSFAQVVSKDSIRAIMDRSVGIIETHSINNQHTAAIKSLLYTEADSIRTVAQLAPLYREVFKLLNDHHGGLKYKGKTYGWDLPAGAENNYIKNKLRDGHAVYSTLLEDTMGYLRIPGNTDFGFKKVDSIAGDIITHINAINSSNVKGWIIDLRLNTGGNMYPILLGLRDFIGNNVIFGGFRNAMGEPSGEWKIEEASMFIDGIKLDQPSTLTQPIAADIPVVLLTSCYTASAGEMTVISFIGRQHTKILGEPTANYTTAVQGFEINDDMGINLSTDYVVDRNNNIYKENIQPDVPLIGGDNLDDLSADAKIIRALELIRTMRKAD